MFAFLEELMDQIDPHLGALYKPHEIVYLYKIDMKTNYKTIKPKVGKAIEAIGTAREEKLWPEASHLIRQKVLLLEKEIKDNNYKLSAKVIKIQN